MAQKIQQDATEIRNLLIFVIVAFDGGVKLSPLLDDETAFLPPELCVWRIGRGMAGSCNK